MLSYDNECCAVYIKSREPVEVSLEPSQVIQQGEVRFIVIEGVKFGEKLILNDQTYLIDNLVSCFDLIENKTQFFNIGDDFVVFISNFNSFGVSNEKFELEFSNFYPVLKSEGISFFVLRNPQKFDFLVNNKKIQFLLSENENKQDYQIENFKFQMILINFHFKTQEKRPIKQISTKQVQIGHRGQGKNPLTQVHENTVFSVENTLKKYDGTEFDVNMTADKKLVITHDLGVESKYGKLAINHLTQKQFQSIELLNTIKPSKITTDDFKLNETTPYLRNETFRPTYAQIMNVFKKYPGKLAICEIKYPNIRSLSIGQQYFGISVLLKEILEETERINPEFLIFSSFNPQIVLALKNCQNRYPVMYLNCGNGEIQEDEEVDYNLDVNRYFTQGLNWIIEHKIHCVCYPKEFTDTHLNEIKKAKEQGIYISTYANLPEDNDELIDCRITDKVITK